MQQSDRVQLTVGGQVFSAWSRIEITRDLAELAGSFVLSGLDVERARRALPAGAAATPFGQILAAGAAAVVTIDGEVVLTGYIDQVQLRADGESVAAAVQGRDKAGDLVDCSAAPRGPAEFRNLTLTDIATRLCEPFGIKVTADADVGAPFPVFALDVSETVLSALEKAARQRGLLIVSDGIGGIRLTAGGGGAAQAPAPLRWGDNVLEVEATLSWENRFSPVIVKGQSQAAALALDGTAQPLSPTAAPTATAALAPAPEQDQVRQRRAGIALAGEASDPEITRWRPIVLQARTQSGGTTAKTQAEWSVRVARSAGRSAVYTVQDWRAGPERRLWRPNELVLVDDIYDDLMEEMLVAGVVYVWEEAGATTRLRVVGKHALDLLAEAEERPRQRLTGRAAPAASRAARAKPALDGTANTLTAE